VKFSGVIAVLTLLAQSVCAQNVVDTKSPLELISSDFELADGPAWDGKWALSFPDVKGQKLYRYIPKTGKVEVVHKSIGRISAAFYNLGELYLSDNANGQICKLVNGKKVTLTEPEGQGKDLARPNDLVVDNQGGLYFTLTKQGRVMYRSPKGKLSVAVASVNSPNGITLSPDGKVLYVAAYRPKEIWAYAIQAPGKTAEGSLFSKMDDGEALGADGMTIDRSGNVYCAGATDIWIWNSKGKLLGKIACPTRPINCAFGDSDMRSLYITGFGGLYRQRMNVYGKTPEPASGLGQRDKATAPTKTPKVAKSTRPSTTIPENVRLIADQQYGQVGTRKLLADLCIPDNKQTARPAIVVVHGGGWLNGDKTKFRALTLDLARRGYVTMAIEYRLGHEARFPAGIQDCNTAVRFLKAHAKDFGVDPERIGAVGGSAGGHLVGLMATGWQDKAIQGSEWPDESSRLKAAIVMAGPMEMTTGSVAQRSRTIGNKSNSNVWLGKTIDEAPELYRLADAHLHISAESSPILFMVGEHDKPERNQPSRDKLKAAGVWSGLKVYQDGKHGCWNQLPWFSQMTDDMDAFFKRHLAK
jgi:gluconolactonase